MIATPYHPLQNRPHADKVPFRGEPRGGTAAPAKDTVSPRSLLKKHGLKLLDDPPIWPAAGTGVAPHSGSVTMRVIYRLALRLRPTLFSLLQSIMSNRSARSAGFDVLYEWEAVASGGVHPETNPDTYRLHLCLKSTAPVMLKVSASTRFTPIRASLDHCSAHLQL